MHIFICIQDVNVHTYTFMRILKRFTYLEALTFIKWDEAEEHHTDNDDEHDNDHRDNDHHHYHTDCLLS